MSEAVERAPKLFVRRIAIPPAPPWDQAKAARLEAHYGAPLAGGQLVWSLRRLRPWRMGAAGEFAVAYARPTDVETGRATSDLDGESITFFFPRAGAGRRMIWLAANAVAVALAVGGVALAGERAWAIRGARETALARLEDSAFRLQRQARVNRRLASQARQLTEAGLDGRSFADLGADLYWLAQAKGPGVRLEGVSWRKGEMIVKAAGPNPPVQGRERVVVAVDDKGGGWRISAAVAPVMKSGQARPSVVSRARPPVTASAP